MPVGGDMRDRFCYRCDMYVSMVYNEEEEDFVCPDCYREMWLAEQEAKKEIEEKNYDNL